MNDEQLVERLEALAGETRLRILRRLQSKALRCTDAARCSLTPHCCTVGELAQAVGVTVPTASHHLRELRRAGLIRMQRRGRTVEVSLATDVWQALAAALGDFARHGNLEVEPTHG